MALATKLHDLLEEAERQAPSARRAFVRALYPDQKDPAKRLDELALPRGAPAKRQDRLRRKAKVYLEAAKALASVRGLSEDEVIEDLFSVVSHVAPAVTSPDPLQLDVQQEFWDRWMGMNKAILEECGTRLQHAFQLRMRYGQPGEGQRPLFVVPWEQPVLSGVAEADFLAQSERNSLVRELPGVFLGQATGPVLTATGRATASDGTERTLVGKARVWFRFYWCFAPFGARQDPRPAIRVVVTPQCFPWAEACEGPEPGSATSERPADGATDAWHEVVDPVALWSRAWTRLVGDEPRPRGDGSCFEVAWLDSVTEGGGKVRLAAEWDEPAKILARHFANLEHPVPPDSWGRVACLRQPDRLWRDVLSLPDGSDTDWVGPDPERRLLRLPPEPKAHDFPDGDAHDRAFNAWLDSVFEIEAQEEQERFLDWHGRSDGPLRAFQSFQRRMSDPQAAEPGQAGSFVKYFGPTLGQKLEWSVLELPDERKPHVELRRRVEAYIREAEQRADQALGEWRRALNRAMRASRNES